MKAKFLVLCSIFIMFMSMSVANAKNCGHYLGKKIHTYGGLSCCKAKVVYKAFTAGNIPQGWTCGQSVGGCGKGTLGFYFK